MVGVGSWPVQVIKVENCLPIVWTKPLCCGHMARLGSPGSFSDKEPACRCRRHKKRGFDPWVRKIPWRRKWQTHSSILAWRILRTEEPGGLKSMGSQRVKHGLATEHACGRGLRMVHSAPSGCEYGLRWPTCLELCSPTGENVKASYHRWTFTIYDTSLTA